MAPSPKRILQIVLSEECLDDDPGDWDAPAAIARDQEGVGSVADELQRVTSRVQSCADGSAEAVLAAAAPSLSQTRSTVVSPCSLSESLPAARTESNPTQTTNRAGAGIISGNGSGEQKKSLDKISGNSPNRIAYEMRKVFSLEDKGEWRHQEVEESVHRRSSEYADYENWQDAPTLNSVSCVPTHVHGRSAEEEAELVPDEAEFDTTDVDNKTADANVVMAITANAPFEEREKSTTERYNSKSGYKLRTFLSTPSIIKSQKAFALRRTPSYEPEGYNEYGEAEYDEEFEKESPLHINGKRISRVRWT